MLIRQLSPYEKNHLLRYGFNPENIDQYGEMPVEYITGKALFLGREFTVTPDVLIPRVETEELVELIQQDLLKNHQTPDQTVRIADVGTGSGVIGLSLTAFFEKQGWPFEITLTDVSSVVLGIAQANYQQLFLKSLQHGQLNFLKADLLANFPQDKKINLIAVNLPYIPTQRISALSASVKDFEPVMALDGGSDGLKYIFQLLEQAKTTLKPEGKIYLELDDTHTAEQFQSFANTYQFEFRKDQFDKPRFAVATLQSSL